MKKEEEDKIIKALKLDELKKSLQDVIGMAPESISFEFPNPEKTTKGFNDGRPWGVNFYTYRFG